MKPFREQSYYELLEVAPEATDDEIRVAHRRLTAQFSDDSVAMYGLADASEAKALRLRLLEAVAILTDADLRGEYDRSLGLPPRPVPPAADDEQQASRQMAMSELLTAAEARHSTQPGYQISYIPHRPVPGEANQAVSVEVAAPRPSPAAPQRPATLVDAEPADGEVRPERPAPAVEPPVTAPSRPPSQVAPGSAGPIAAAAEPAASGPDRPADIVAPAAPTPRVVGREPLDTAPEMAQEAAIASAEAALAQVSARVREPRLPVPVEPKPKPFEVPPDAEFNGELLRQVRQARGMSLEQLAERTRIIARHLGNVEADRYDALPATVYLRGILMNIARELGLDPLRVSKSYLALVGSARKA